MEADIRILSKASANESHVKAIKHTLTSPPKSVSAGGPPLKYLQLKKTNQKQNRGKTNMNKSGQRKFTKKMSSTKLTQ